MAEPKPSSANWDDLTVRMASSAAMTVVGAVGVILGGVWFQMLVVFVSAVMIWELWMMIRPHEPTPGMLLAALAASVMSGQLVDGSQWAMLLFLVVPVIGAVQLRTEIKTFFIFALGIQLAGWGLVHFRTDYGFTWLLWLMSVVIVTDIFGYFAGKTFGGPKFWPKISPKKTWSGTIAGWLGAGLVGFLFTMFTAAGWWIIALSMILSFAGQMGDIAESALKRRMGVKDSSTLIPGHGGLFDRFDALLGAALFMLLVASFFDVPGVAF
ncbi:phosphatidate cytidylyltransferase [Yoonia sp. SS1-5]|uniref:Phosphatidate cytidylyltransferase n=1 Tax=Yoonia rhodophyticola TaxID=3137370 RepID=A0AAN0M7R3_9RHOB